MAGIKDEIRIKCFTAVLRFGDRLIPLYNNNTCYTVTFNSSECQHNKYVSEVAWQRDESFTI